MMALAVTNDTLNTATGYTNFTENIINGTGLNDDPTPGIHPVHDPYPEHKLMWRIGIIFAVSGIIILGSFIAMFGVNYTRRRCLFRRQRRRAHPQQTLAFENQLSVTQDELVEQMRREYDHVTVHQSCTSSDRRWSRDENMPRPRSRSNSRSRSLSPGGSRARSPMRVQNPRTPHNELEDDTLIHTGLEKLENARLAFTEDAPRFAEYDSTKDRVDIGV